MPKRDFSGLSGVLFLTGPPGAGKTTLAEELSGRHPRSVHVDLDVLRRFVQSGFADPTLEWNEETRLQFRLARTAARSIAEIYAAAGYLVFVDDMYVPSPAETQIWAPASLPVLGRIVLLPDVKVALARNSGRDRGKVTARLAAVIPRITREFHADLPLAPEWTVVDNSDMTVEETADLVEAIATSTPRPSNTRPRRESPARRARGRRSP